MDRIRARVFALEIATAWKPTLPHAVNPCFEATNPPLAHNSNFITIKLTARISLPFFGTD